MITFDNQPYVFVSLADGPVVYYLFDSEKGLIYDRKKVPLGTKPTTLTICQQIDHSSPSTSRTVLFACSDHPSVISSSNSKIIFSSVNLREIVCMCSLNSEYYGSSLTLVTDMGVLLGRIEDIQKLHVRSLALGEAVRRIAFMEPEKIFLILTQYLEDYQTEKIIPISRQAQRKIDCPTKIKAIEEIAGQQSNDVHNSLVILDQHTHEGEPLISSSIVFAFFSFAAHTSVNLLNGEEGTSLCVISFANDLSKSYVAMGTAFVVDEDDTVRHGRIVLFRYEDGRVTMINEKEVTNVPYAMLSYHGKLLVAIGNTVRRSIGYSLEYISF